MAEEAVVLNQDGTGTQVNAEENANAEAQGAGDGGPQANANEGEVEPEHKRKGGWQRTIEKLEKRLDERERVIDSLLGRVSTAGGNQVEVKKPAEDVEPNEEDFPTLGEYLKAARAWDRKQVKREIEAENQTREKVEQSKSRVQKVAETWNAKVAAVKDELKDFEEIAYAPDVPYSPAMTEAVAESDEGARIAYFLGQNLKEAERISKLGPIAAAKEIGKLEARFAKTEQAEGEEKPEPPQTRAPKPPTPISKPSAAKAPSIHDPDLPYKDFVKLREAQKKG